MKIAENIKAASLSDVLPEFGRVQDVRRLFGVKRGLTYRWINEGKIKSVCLREPGNKQGIRLINLVSVRDYIRSQTEQPTVG